MKIHRILVIELLGGIGDLLIALPMIQALARTHPQAELSVLTFAPGGELLQHDPAIARVLYAHNGAKQAVIELLSRETFDLIVSDTNYDGIAEIITDSSTPHLVTNLWRSPPPDELISERFLNILLAEGLIDVNKIASDEAQLHLTATEIAMARQALGAAFRPLIFLIPDAGMPIKQWPLDYFIALGQDLQKQLQATILITSSLASERAEQIVKKIGGSARIWPTDSLRSLAAVLSQGDLAIAADTGPARIAAALKVPTITLFGPSWGDRYGQSAPHVNLQGFPACPERVINNFTEQRCWYSGQCPFEYVTCLADITPEQVFQAALELLQKARGKNAKDLSLDCCTSQSQIILNPVNTPPFCRDVACNVSTEFSEKDKGVLTIGFGISTNQNTFPLTPSPFPFPQSQPWQAVRNLLVMRLDNIGDVIMIGPAVRALKENLPQANITLMASPAGAKVAPLLYGIDSVLPQKVLWQDLGGLDFNPQREWQLIQQLKQQHFDAAIIFTSFSQSPHPPALICALAGIPLRLGESKESDGITLTHSIAPAPDDIHQVERNLRLIESMGIAVSDRHLALNIPKTARQAIQPLRDRFPNYLLLNPWTSCSSRNYDPERFAIVAQKLSEITSWPVLVTGLAKDRQRSGIIFEKLGNHAINLLGKTNVAELAALVAGAKLVLTNNTSTMHVAEATATPSVILFAGTELESQWQPRYASTRLLRRPTVCSPCYALSCLYHKQCLDIPVEAVVTAGLELLALN